MQWVGTPGSCEAANFIDLFYSHIHVSLRDQDGKSLFAVSPSELENGRQGAAYPDTKYLSQEGEWFLAGVLRGLPDSKSISK